MAWTTPPTHSVGDVLTASDWNAVANDVILLSGTAYATVATSESRSTASYGDLSTVGPSVTLTTGANALVTVTAEVLESGGANVGLVGFAVSGATTIAAADATALQVYSPGTLAPGLLSATFGVALTAGSNTFTLKYKVQAATAVSFSNRSIIVQPLP